MIGPRERGEGVEQQQEEDDDEGEDEDKSLSSSGEQESKDDQAMERPSKSQSASKEHSRRPNVRARAGSCTTCSPSKVAKLAGDFGTHTTEKARHSLPLHIKSWSPGCSFPWA